MRITRHCSFLVAWLTLLTAIGLILPQRTVSAQGRPSFIYIMTVSGDRSVFAASNYSKPMRIDIYSNSTGQWLRSFDLDSTTLQLMALSPNGDRLAYTDASGCLLCVYDITTGEKIILVPGGPLLLSSLAWSPVSDEISYAIEREIMVIDASNGRPVRSMMVATSTVGITYTLQWSRDGHRLAGSVFSVPERRQLQVWDVSSEEKQLDTPIAMVDNRGGGSIVFSPHGDRVASVLRNTLGISTLGVVDVATSTIIAARAPADVIFSGIDWSPDGSRVVSSGDKLRIWDTSTWQVVQEIDVHSLSGYVHWSQDGQHVFSEGSKGLYRDGIPLALLNPTVNPATSTATSTP
jgi:WD40 repeat protein